jgi:hypothetical protein
MQNVSPSPHDRSEEEDPDMTTPLSGKNILLIEHQPLVAADIEDRLWEGGAAGVTIVSKSGQAIELAGFDGLIVNATQDRDLARSVIDAQAALQYAVVILHDDESRARDLFPAAAIVEIPFDSAAVRDALVHALDAPRR